MTSLATNRACLFHFRPLGKNIPALIFILFWLNEIPDEKFNHQYPAANYITRYVAIEYRDTRLSCYKPDPAKNGQH